MPPLVLLESPKDGIIRTQDSVGVFDSAGYRGAGKLFLTRSGLMWIIETVEPKKGFAVFYPSITCLEMVNDLTRFPEECLCLTVKPNEEIVGDTADEDLPAHLFRLVPVDKASLPVLEAAISDRLVHIQAQEFLPVEEDLASDPDLAMDLENEEEDDDDDVVYQVDENLVADPVEDESENEGENEEEEEEELIADLEEANEALYRDIDAVKIRVDELTRPLRDARNPHPILTEIVHHLHPGHDVGVQTFLTAKKLGGTDGRIDGGRRLTSTAFARFLLGKGSLVPGPDLEELEAAAHPHAQSSLSERFISVQQGPVPIMQNPRLHKSLLDGNMSQASVIISFDQMADSLSTVNSVSSRLKTPSQIPSTLSEIVQQTLKAKEAGKTVNLAPSVSLFPHGAISAAKLQELLVSNPDLAQKAGLNSEEIKKTGYIDPAVLDKLTKSAAGTKLLQEASMARLSPELKEKLAEAKLDPEEMRQMAALGILAPEVLDFVVGNKSAADLRKKPLKAVPTVPDAKALIEMLQNGSLDPAVLDQLKGNEEIAELIRQVGGTLPPKKPRKTSAAKKQRHQEALANPEILQQITETEAGAKLFRHLAGRMTDPSLSEYLTQAGLDAELVARVGQEDFDFGQLQQIFSKEELVRLFQHVISAVPPDSDVVSLMEDYEVDPEIVQHVRKSSTLGAKVLQDQLMDTLKDASVLDKLRDAGLSADVLDQLGRPNEVNMTDLYQQLKDTGQLEAVAQVPEMKNMFEALEEKLEEEIVEEPFTQTDLAAANARLLELLAQKTADSSIFEQIMRAASEARDSGTALQPESPLTFKATKEAISQTSIPTETLPQDDRFETPERPPSEVAQEAGPDAFDDIFSQLEKERKSLARARRRSSRGSQGSQDAGRGTRGSLGFSGHRGFDTATSETQTSGAQRLSSITPLYNMAAAEQRMADQEELFASIMQGSCDKCGKPILHMELTDLFRHKLLHRSEAFVFDPEHFCCPEFQKEVEKLLFTRGTMDVVDRPTRQSRESSDLRDSQSHKHRRKRARPRRRRESSQSESVRRSTVDSVDEEDQERENSIGFSELDAIADMLRAQDGIESEETEEEEMVPGEYREATDEEDADLPEDMKAELKERRRRTKLSMKAAAKAARTRAGSKTTGAERRGTKQKAVKGQLEPEAKGPTGTAGPHPAKKKLSTSATPKASVSTNRKTSYIQRSASDSPADSRYKGNTMTWALSSYACTSTGWTLKHPVAHRTRSYLVTEKVLDHEAPPVATAIRVRSSQLWPLLPTTVIHWPGDSLVSEFAASPEPTGYFPYFDGRTAFVTAEYAPGQSVVVVLPKEGSWGDAKPAKCPVAAVFDTGAWGVIIDRDPDWTPRILATPTEVLQPHDVFHQEKRPTDWISYRNNYSSRSARVPSYENDEMAVDVLGPHEIVVQLQNDAMKVHANCAFRRRRDSFHDESGAQTNKFVTAIEKQLEDMRKMAHELDVMLQPAEALWTDHRDWLELDAKLASKKEKPKKRKGR